MNHDSLQRAAARAQREQALLARLRQMVEQVQQQLPLATREEAEDLAIGVMSQQAVGRGLLARHDDRGTIDRAAATLARLAPERSFVQWADQGAMQEPAPGATPPALSGEPDEVRLLREDGMRLGKMPVHKVTPRMALAAVRQNAAALQFINPSFVLENEALREYVVSNWDAWQESSPGPGGDGGISQLLRDQVGQTQARILELRLKDALATHRQQQASQADTAYPRERN